jgi:hypothetical protein
MTGNEFGKWLDANGVSVSDASSHFGVSEKTIYQWRSTIGIPDRKLEWVLAQMTAYIKRASATPTLDRLVLEITNEQFAAWNEAALDEGLLLKDWAIQTLDDVAADSTGSGEAPNPLQSLPRAAEDGAAYIAKKKDAAG